MLQERSLYLSCECNEEENFSQNITWENCNIFIKKETKSEQWSHPNGHEQYK